MIPAGAAKTLHCPVDGSTLDAPQAGGSIRRCPGCEGALFGNARLVQIIKNNGFDVLKLRPHSVTTRACSSCTAPMRIYEVDGIEIDLCPLCALVWMDKGEFPKVRAYLDQAEADRRSGAGRSLPEPRIGPLDLPQARTSDGLLDTPNEVDAIFALIDLFFRVVFRNRW